MPFCRTLKSGSIEAIVLTIYLSNGSSLSQRLRSAAPAPLKPSREFAGKGANLKIYGTQYHGTIQVAARILTYGYLWNTIRVKGGAYGTGLSISENGDVTFTSFRDPSVANSLVRSIWQ